MESIDVRKNALTEWLGHCAIGAVSLQPMPNDASFRRYFRVYTKAGSYVAMDAYGEANCVSFVAIAKALYKLGLHTPEIIAAEAENGFLLLTDFGDSTYLRTLNPQNADQLYHEALKSLALLQSCKEVPGCIIPPFDGEFMWLEWMWHKEWFINKLLSLSLSTSLEEKLDQCFALIIESATRQPQVFMHRDYHSANLMVLPGKSAVGILDFQDAFIGPVTYDLVSLLRDCYIDWPNERVTHWVLEYWRELNNLHALTNVSQDEFLRWFDWMGLQRHLKALMTFARKYKRDQQANYLNYIPRTLNYLLTVSGRYPQFIALHDYLLQTVQPAFERTRHLCAV